MFKLRKYSVWCAGLIFTVSSGFGQTSTTANGQTLLQWPPIGLASTETAQVNVLNTALPPANGGVEPFCSGTVVYYNAAGNVLGPLNTFQLRPGQMFSARLPFASANAPEQRTLVRTIIYLSRFNVSTGADQTAVAPCQIASSIETYDTATGVTHALISGQATLVVPGATMQ